MKKVGKSSKKGFTLVELIVVLVILAVLAAMLVPALVGYIDRAKKEKEYQAASTVYAAVQALATETYGKDGKLTVADAKSTFTREQVKELTGVTVNDVQYSVKGSSTKIDEYTINYIAIQFNANEDYYQYVAGGEWSTIKTPALPDGVSGTIAQMPEKTTTTTGG